MNKERTPTTDADRLPAEAMSRRGVLRGATAGGLVVPLLVACGSDATEDPTAGATSGDGESPSPSASPSESAGAPAGDPPPSGPTVATSDVPVGGGTILSDDLVVVTQPAEGEFKAFSAKCTHMGCPVQTVEDGRIGCNCHGSGFSIEDGSVVNGPATKPLEELSVTVDGDQVVVG